MEVMQNADAETQKYKPGGRLDMNHGFLHHIRRNQIARDDYDREVKQAKEQQKRRHTAAPRRPRRPDREVYHPRHRNDSGAGDEVEAWYEIGSSIEHENTGTELFWLDYEADGGHVTSLLVYKEDEPESVVGRVEQENVLDVDVRAALIARITREMDKRRDNC